MNTGWMTAEERAKEEYRSLAAIYQENHRGGGPPQYRIGKRVLYRRDEVEQWRLSRIVRSTAEVQP